MKTRLHETTKEVFFEQPKEWDGTVNQIDDLIEVLQRLQAQIVKKSLGADVSESFYFKHKDYPGSFSLDSILSVHDTDELGHDFYVEIILK